MVEFALWEEKRKQESAEMPEERKMELRLQQSGASAKRWRRVIATDMPIPGFGGIAGEVKKLPARRPIPPVAVGAGKRERRGK